MRRRFLQSLTLAFALGALVLGVAVLRSELPQPEPTQLLRDHQGRFLAEVAPTALGDEVYGYWPLKNGRLPPRVVAATLAVEDRRFQQHPGVDPIAVARAAWQNLRHGRRISGASTIAMQLARLSDPGPRTWSRKVSEALRAVAFTLRHGREAVLERYLTLVPYGNRVRGIHYAARIYLDKPVADLSWAEVAFLCAIPQSPGRMNPYDPEGRARAESRARRILALLRHRDHITEDTHAVAERELLRMRILPRRERPPVAMHALLRLDSRLRRERSASVPLLVDSEIDLDFQRLVTEVLGEGVASLRTRGVGNGAAMIVDLRDHAIRAVVGSTDYFDASHSGAIDYSATPRSPGSTLKPFIYGLAMTRDLLTPTSVLDDLEWAPEAVRNSDDRHLGPLLPRVALANSRNVTAVRLLRRIGLHEGYAHLGELGLHAFERAAEHYGLGLAVGAMPVTLAQLVGAYATLASDGRERPLRWLRHEGLGPGRPVIPPAVARRLALYLSDPMARLPAFPRAGHLEVGGGAPIPVAVKTGTSSGYRDSWAVAFSRRWLVGVWLGHPDRRPMKGLGGYGGAAGIVQTLLTRLHTQAPQPMHTLRFPQPEGTAEAEICGLSGGLATRSCERVHTEHLRGEEHPPQCPVHRPDGLALPPRYARWAAAEGRSLLDAPEAPPTLALESPRGGLVVYRDPDTPAAYATLPLRAQVRPQLAQAVWFVDGEPLALVEPPYDTRWPLAPGAHIFELRSIDGRLRSERVRVVVH